MKPISRARREIGERHQRETPGQERHQRRDRTEEAPEEALGEAPGEAPGRSTRVRSTRSQWTSKSQHQGSPEAEESWPDDASPAPGQTKHIFQSDEEAAAVGDQAGQGDPELQAKFKATAVQLFFKDKIGIWGIIVLSAGPVIILGAMGMLAFLWLWQRKQPGMERDHA